MSREEKLLAAAREAVGDETINDVAEFEPKGTAGAMAAGAVAGSLVGGAVSGDGWGEAIGSGVGSGAGMLAADYGTATARGLPPQVCVAISPSSVYLMGMPKIGVAHLDPIGKIDRDRLGIEIHQPLSVRTVVLEDLDTGANFPLELPRLNVYHGKAMVELLMIGAEHADEQELELSS